MYVNSVSLYHNNVVYVCVYVRVSITATYVHVVNINSKYVVTHIVVVITSAATLRCLLVGHQQVVVPSLLGISPHVIQIFINVLFFKKKKKTTSPYLLHCVVLLTELCYYLSFLITHSVSLLWGKASFKHFELVILILT